MRSFDIALNVLWMSLCIGAVVYHAISERRSRTKTTRHARTRRALSLFLAAVSLFPCVSATDDIVSLRGLNGRIHSDTTVSFSRSDTRPEAPFRNLARLLELLEHYQISVARAVFISVLSVAILIFTERRRPTFFGVPQTGRAPPSLCFSL